MTAVADGEGRSSATERWLTGITRHPVPVLAACIAFTLLAGLAAVNLLGVNSDPIAMLDEDLPFRQTDERLRAEFPDLENNLLAVVEAPTPEQATLAARQVQRELAKGLRLEGNDGHAWAKSNHMHTKSIHKIRLRGCS